MIEISKTDKRREEKTRIKKRKGSSGVSRNQKTFDSQFQSRLKFSFEGTIDELLSELDEQERKFIDKQTEYELSRYKALIQKILKTVLDKSFKTQKIKARRRSVELIVHDIDDKLLEIKTAIINNKGFNLLKKIDEIRGLIFDLIY